MTKQLSLQERLNLSSKSLHCIQQGIHTGESLHYKDKDHWWIEYRPCNNCEKEEYDVWIKQKKE